MRDFFEDICLPMLLFGLVMYGLCQAGASYYCSQIGDMYELNSKTVLLECYVETPKGWMTGDDFKLARLFGRL